MNVGENCGSTHFATKIRGRETGRFHMQLERCEGHGHKAIVTILVRSDGPVVLWLRTRQLDTGLGYHGAGWVCNRAPDDTRVGDLRLSAG